MSITLKQLALDVYNGKSVMFNEVSGEDAIKNAVIDACGGKFDIYTYNDNKYKVFAILSEVLTLPVEQELGVLFPGIVSVENVALGDKKEWKITRPQRFRVAKIASGTQDIRRQKIGNREYLTIETETLAVKIYADLAEFMAGRINFSELVDNVNKSFAKKTAEIINAVFMDSFNSLRSDMKKSGTIVESELLDLITKVEAYNECSCSIYGTKQALSKIAKVSTMVSEKSKEKYEQLGHFGHFFTTPLVEMQQMVNLDGELLLDDDALYILPNGQDIIKVIYEGETFVNDTTAEGGRNRNDLQVEYFVSKKMGVGVLVPNRFGVWDIA